MQGMDGNFSHLLERSVRIGSSDKECFRKAANGLMKRLKDKRIPSTQWYKRIQNNGIFVGYICGQGTYISTILSKDMVPKGKEI